MEKIGLCDLLQILKGAHFKLDISFIKKLLMDASNSSEPHKNLDFVRFLGCKINKKLSLSLGIYQWMNGRRTIKGDKLISIMSKSSFSWKDVESHIIYIKAGIHKGEVNPRFPIYIDEKMGSIIGHILGDGSIAKNMQPFYSNSNILLLKEFYNHIYSIFGVGGRIWVSKNNKFEEKSEWDKRVYNFYDIPKGRCVGIFYPRIIGLILNHVFDNFAVGKSKSITPPIINSTKKFKSGFIRAFYDDESSVYPESYTIRVFQDNKKVLSCLQNMLTEFNINPNDIRQYIKYNKKRHYFNITRKDNHMRFYNQIGYTSPIKREKLKKMLRLDN